MLTWWVVELNGLLLHWLNVVQTSIVEHQPHLWDVAKDKQWPQSSPPLTNALFTQEK